MIFEFDPQKNEDFYQNVCAMCSQDLEERINIHGIALDITRNWQAYQQSGDDIQKEFLFSIDELADFFYICIDKRNEFAELLTKAHKYFQNNKEKYGYRNMSYNICGTIYFCLPNLLKKNWPLFESIITLSIYYREQR